MKKRVIFVIFLLLGIFIYSQAEAKQVSFLFSQNDEDISYRIITPWVGGEFSYFPENAVAFSESTTISACSGTGKIILETTEGSFANAECISETSSTISGDCGLPPAGLSFPFGLVSFKITGITPGNTIGVYITYPEDFPSPATYTYWKCGENPESTGPEWYQHPLILSGERTIRIPITDGARGDDDLTENGEIIEPGGLAVGSVTPPPSGNLDGVYKDKDGTLNLNVYVQHYATGTLLIYTFDTATMGVFWDDEITGKIFEGDPVNPSLTETAKLDFNTNTLTITNTSTQVSTDYELTKWASVDAARSTDGIYKSTDATLDLNIYMQTYDNGGTLLIYTFDTTNMVASWDAEIEDDIFDGMFVNPDIAQRAIFVFAGNLLLVIHTDTGNVEAYPTYLFERAIH